QDRQAAVTQGRHHAPAVDREIFRLVLLTGLEVHGAERERQPRQREVQHRLVARARGEAAVQRQPFHRCAGHRVAAYSASSIASALETPYSPGFSTWSFFTTPLSTSIA